MASDGLITDNGNQSAEKFGVKWVDVRQGLTTQTRVIHALIMRETLSRYGDHKLGFMWALLEPVFMVTVFVGFMSLMSSGSPGGMPLIPFMITGIVPYTMFRNTMNQMQGAISANRSLLGFPQVTTFDVIIARAILEGAVLLCVFAFMIAMTHLIGYEVRIENPLGVLLSCLTLLVLGSGFGFFFACLMPIFPSIGQISSLVLGRPLLISSGLFFTVGSVPSPIREYLLYNPILHLIELQRSYFFHEYESSYGSWSYALGWMIGALVCGLLMHQALRRRAIVGI